MITLFIGIEKEEKYFEIAKDRINNNKSERTISVATVNHVGFLVKR